MSTTLTSKVTELRPSSIPIFTTLSALREWRTKAFKEDKRVGFVPTMGALHEGHLSLVRASLAANDLTILSIFVNPTQFAPHEDLASYPRTLPHDLEQLHALSVTVQTSGSSETRTPSAIFLPTIDVMYPTAGSALQDVREQKGTFVEVKGFGELMEGRSRPTFFRGVATVVTKLFNAIQPTHAYFGQKDIQQGLLLRRLASDLLLAHPTPETLHIVPTTRSAPDGLALSSRNAYLTPIERPFAGALYAALNAGKAAWDGGAAKSIAISRATAVLANASAKAESQGVSLRVDYVEINDAGTFEVLEDARTRGNESDVVILSGAMWVGKTRLIDNIILGDSGKVLY